MLSYSSSAARSKAFIMPKIDNDYSTSVKINILAHVYSLKNASHSLNLILAKTKTPTSKFEGDNLTKECI